MVRGSLHSNRTPRGGDAIKKLIMNLKLLTRQVQLRWLRTSSLQLRAINMLKKSYFVLDNNDYYRSYKNAFLFNSTSYLGYGLEGVTHQRLDCTYFLTFDLLSSCLDLSYQTLRKNL